MGLCHCVCARLEVKTCRDNVTMGHGPVTAGNDCDMKTRAVGRPRPTV